VIIFAVDTSADLASIAIRKDGLTLAQRVIATQDGHAQIIFPAIAEVMQQAGVGLKDVDCFGAAHGPGSFTGVRIALAIVKGFADACGKPAIGISNLRALASFGTRALRSPVMDARRGEVYTAVYRADLQIAQPEIVISLEQWTASLDPQIELISEMPPGGLAGAVALCAEIDGPGLWMDPAGLDALYIRRDDANSFWRD
jgi:tRNA threonylcarbamoyladenosine biosynthesis protein TsaB